jgi:hypothetical protein
MLKRAWFVFAITWAGLFLFNGFTRVDGITRLDVGIALFPLLLAKVARFIVLGVQPRAIPYRPYRGR